MFKKYQKENLLCFQMKLEMNFPLNNEKIAVNCNYFATFAIKQSQMAKSTGNFNLIKSHFYSGCWPLNLHVTKLY